MNRRRAGEGGGRREEAPNPLATIEDIQRRLIRPSSSRPSPIPTSSIKSQIPFENDPKRRDSLQIQTKRSNEDEKERKRARKLEDYLNPVLLAAICSKMKDKRGEEEEEMKSKVSTKDFEWPIDELKTLMDDDSRSDEKKRRKREWSDGDDDGAVNLNDDFDGGFAEIDGGEEDEEEEEGGVVCSPFGRFEKTVLNLFKR